MVIPDQLHTYYAVAVSTATETRWHAFGTEEGAVMYAIMCTRHSNARNGATATVIHVEAYHMQGQEERCDGRTCTYAVVGTEA